MASAETVTEGGRDKMEGAVSVRYFLAKCINMNSLKQCHKSCVWGCSDRTHSPQPRDLLRQAFDQSEVILIFSVNNCHGYHGYASMQTKPEFTEGIHKVAEPIADDTNAKWYMFNLNWKKLYLVDHGEKCLPFSETKSLRASDGRLLSQARNYQEIPSEVGKELCDAIDKHYNSLTVAKEEKQRERSRKEPAPFFVIPEKLVCDADQVWELLLDNVSGLGEVLLACPFGSQRYNLATEESDIDMFVVYSAPCKDILGFQPPPHTIKSREGENFDYSIVEIHRYCELLLAGDPKTVETLFMSPSTWQFASEKWLKLKSKRDLFLTKQTLDKYLRDAKGSKGLKQFEKLEKSGVAFEEPINKKVCKLSYIILRLLQNALHIFQGSLEVFREDDSAEKELLMRVRKGLVPFNSISDTIHSLLGEVEKFQSEKQIFSGEREEKARNFLADWLLHVRYQSLKEHMEFT